VLIQPRPTDRLDLEAFVYDAFLSRFGCSFVAEAHLAALYSSLQRLHSESRKILMFSRLLGIVDPFPEVRFQKCKRKKEP
jgi:hypothetical protein